MISLEVFARCRVIPEFDLYGDEITLQYLPRIDNNITFNEKKLF